MQLCAYTTLVPLIFTFQDYDPYEENPGSAPFSEPETQIMRKICASFEPHVWVNVHSGMEASILLLVCLAAVCLLNFSAYIKHTIYKLSP